MHVTKYAACCATGRLYGSGCAATQLGAVPLSAVLTGEASAADRLLGVSCEAVSIATH
jgi:hypothetical protein